jgi:type IV pilus assembly protein PilW
MNHFQHAGFSSRRYQRGVNLIEIMVAMVIGLFLVLGATTLYVSTKKTSDVDDSIARLQETARYALSIMEADVRMANYWGLKKDGADVENKVRVGGGGSSGGALATGVACGANYAVDTEFYVDASNNGAYGLACAAFAGAASATADTLTVRRAATAATAASNANLQMCTNRKTATITRSAAATCPGGEFHNLITNGYYVDQGSDQSTTYPSLRRKTLGVNSAGTAPAFNDIEIIPGVEDMQIELGWDNSSTDAAGVVSYVQPGNAVLTNAGAPAGRIVSVRVWLLIRAEAPDFTFTDTRTYTYGDRPAYTPNDNFRRLLVSRTFFVRNVTGT